MFGPLGKIFSFDAMVRALPILMILVGCACLAVSFTIIPQTSSPAWHGITLTIGQSVLVGGVVGVLLDTLKYIGIFKEAIHEVMFSDQYLAGRGDLSDLWLRVTSSITKNKFPALSDHLKYGILNKYIPADKDFYYSRYYRECVVSWHDREKGIVEIDEMVEIDLVPAPGIKKIVYNYDCLSNSFVTKIDDYFILSSLLIDEKPYVDVIVAVDVVDEYGGTGCRHSYDIELPCKNKHTVQRRTIKRLPLKQEPFFEYSSQNFILDTTVKFRSNSDDLKPIFVSVGTEDFSDNALPGGPWAVHRLFKNLMFPNQGYLIVLQQL